MGNFARDRQTTIKLHERPDLDDREELVELVHKIDFAKANRHLHEPLFQLVKRGPVFDGDVISKSARDELLDVRACAKVWVNGEDGFNAATYFGGALLHVFDWLWGEMNAPRIAKAETR